MGTAKYPEFANFGEYIYYSYANFQMLFYALAHGVRRYDRTCYYFYAKEHNLLDKHRDELEQMDLPFKIKYIQLRFPQPEFFMSEELDNL
jgi:hypothetical protein